MTTLVSCLCVTSGREAFMPWLVWCFDRQTWPTKELVVIDGSSVPFAPKGRPDIRVIATPTSTSVPEKRNLALQAARGRVVAWFDDDDWQHPERIERLVAILTRGAPIAGPRDACIIELFGARAWLYPGFSDSILFNGSGFVTEIARGELFDARYRRASDTVWMSDLVRKCGRLGALPISEPNFFWLWHTTNLSIRPERGRLRKLLRETTIAEVRTKFGADAWGDTDAALEGLRVRLGERC